EAVGVKTGRGKMIQVDENQYTGVANIYAVGDVAGGNLATVGQAQAVRAVRKMFGSGQYTLKDKEAKPYIVWTIPEVAWVGLNEQEAEAKGLNFGLVRVEYSRAVRGIVSGEKGFLKMIYDRPQGRVLGVHICGAQAGELINFGADAVDDGTTIFEILQFVFPAVTYHVLYNVAATEAKLRMGGVQNLSAAASWARVKTAIMKSLEKQQSQMTFEEAVEATFRTFDADGTGHLTAKQLQASMRSIGLTLSDEAVEDMIKEADQQNQGFVDYPDFVTICRTCGMGPVKTAKA
ncbi:lpdA, partial [Symbiodinium sp. CCMP2456]